MIVIGLTGGLSTGKTETAKFFKRLGANVFSADESAFRALRKGAPAHQAVVKLFGKQYLAKNGEIDRRKLAERVFSRPKDLHKLNVLVHPTVIFEALKVIHTCRRKKGVLVLDVPLLFEAKMKGLGDVTVVVRAPLATILERCAKKGVPAPLAKKILRSQWPISRKVRLADFVIDNAGTREALEKQVKQVWDAVQGMDFHF